MAFPTLVPASGTVHSANDQDFITFNGRWYKRSTVEVKVDGGTDLGSRGSNVFKNRGNVTIGRLFGSRAAQYYIKLQGAYSPTATNGSFGISFYRDGGWEDFSNKNFDQDAGFTNWGHGGVQIKDWYNIKHFGSTIWLSDPQDSGRLPANKRPCYFTIHIMKTHGTQTMMIWELKHQGSTNEAMTSTGSMLIGGSISGIEYLNVEMGGNFADGRMTAEWW